MCLEGKLYRDQPDEVLPMDELSGKMNTGSGGS